MNAPRRQTVPRGSAKGRETSAHVGGEVKREGTQLRVEVLNMDLQLMDAVLSRGRTCTTHEIEQDQSTESYLSSERVTRTDMLRRPFRKRARARKRERERQRYVGERRSRTTECEADAYLLRDGEVSLEQPSRAEHGRVDPISSPTACRVVRGRT